MNDLRQRIANLSPEKRALLELRLMQQGVTTANVDTIPRRSNGAPCALSFAQQRLWFLARLDPDSVHYNESKAVRLQGPLHLGALQHALDGVVTRHEALRTVFRTKDGLPVQVITPPATVPLLVLDLGQCPEDEREAVIQQHLTAEIRRPFDLSRDLMLRAALLQLADEDHILLLVTHHIASDGWSTGILWQELSAFYNAHLAGEMSTLPDLPIQYADYALWQREWLQGETLQRQLTYWKEQLAGAPAMLELPTDRPRPPVQTYRGARQTFRLPNTLTAELKALSRQEGVTLFMLLLTALQTLLHRYTGEHDIVVGSPIAGRTRKETEGLIGFFVNTLLLRTNMADNPTFRQLLRQVREVALGAYAHQDVPFEKLVEELQPTRHLSYAPLFQVFFAFQNVPRSVVQLSGLTLSPVNIDNASAKFDLSLYMMEDSDGLWGRLEYNSDLFEAATIQRLQGHWQTLLEGITAQPDRRLGDFPLLTTAEQHQLLVEWNTTQTEYPREACLHDLFAAQVMRTPDAVAVIDQDQQLTYQDLDRRANQVARHLRGLGVGPEVRVGVCIERSAAMVIGLLGVLKAGGAYVPLDPSYPSDRVAFMLHDAQVAILLTHDRLKHLIPAPQVHVVCLDTDWEHLAHENDGPVVSTTTPDQPAYVIYTSGSTGQPKGVLGLHRGAVNRCAWMWQRFPFQPGEVCCQKTSLSFVDSVWEIFGPLLQGIPTVIIPDAVVKDPATLLTTLAAHRVTRIVLVPSLLRVLLEKYDDLHQYVPTLTLWVSSGEALSYDLVQRFRASLPHNTLLNLYGSSEVAADVTWYNTLPCPDNSSHVPIGRPIANTQIYLLDSHLQPVPIGVAGELYVGGDGLARGYLNRPDLTATVFTPHPFSNKPDARLYKTGDVARYLPDGTIELLGRRDHQVKIRGFRIELGEIEAVLRRHPAVREVVVLLREDVPGDQRLVAYVAVEPQSRPTPHDLRSVVQATLPDYMVPMAYVTLDAFPLTPNGKLDRQKLPAPDRTRFESDTSMITPKDTLELQLTAIWQEVLDVCPIGVRDNFFELGGHSLLAVRLFARIEHAIGKPLPLALLFQAPTVEQMASYIRQEGGFVPRTSLVPIQPHGTGRPFFCVHPGAGSVLGFTLLGKYLAPNQPFYGIEARGLYGDVPCLDRIEVMADTYLHDLRAIQPKGPYMLGGRCFGGLVALEMAQQLRAQGEQIALLVIFDTLRLLNVEDELRASLLDVDSISPKPVKSPEERLATRRGRKVRFKQQAKRLGSTYKRMRAVWQACEQARNAYTPKPYPGRITLFRDGPATPIPAHEARWTALAEHGVERHLMPGNHHTLFQEPHVQVLAERLKLLIATA